MLTDSSEARAKMTGAAKQSGKPTDQTAKEEKKVQSGQLWVDKYAPKSQNDIIGNKTTIAKFEEWLRDWDDV